jgi:hypothetical protein
MRLAEENEGWTLGFLGEVEAMSHRQWSRFAQPSMHAWAPSGEPFRLVEREAGPDEEDPKALACYGVYLPDDAAEENTEEEGASGEEASGEEASPENEAESEAESDMLLRFARGRPVSEGTGGGRSSNFGLRVALEKPVAKSD